MKKFIKYILTASFFTAQNLFAQSTTAAEGMDMSVYATWMGSAFLVVFFIMFAVFLYSANKEPVDTETEAILITGAFINSRLNTASGNSNYLLPSLSLELHKIRLLLISALITFSLVLLLLII